MAENTAVFHGFAQAGIAGISEASSQPPITLGDDFDDYPGHVAKAVEVLLPPGHRRARTGWRSARRLHGRDRDHRARRLSSSSTTCATILGGPIVWAPGVDGAIVMSLRGGDFLFESGQDLSIGYDRHDADNGSALPRGELQLPRRDTRGRGHADGIGAAGFSRHQRDSLTRADAHTSLGSARWNSRSS